MKGNLRYLEFFESILDYNRSHKREFAWRNKSASGYEILVSEILLRRTMAARVNTIFKVLISKYPSSANISSAKCEDVEKIIYPLGLKNRCRTLIEAARYLNSHKKHSLKSLMAIPGVGEYTAGAFLIFHLGKNYPIIDTNVRRLFRRYFNVEFDEEIKRILILLPEGEVKDFYYGLLDFSASICRPHPLCYKCPIRRNCFTQKSAKEQSQLLLI